MNPEFKTSCPHCKKVLKAQDHHHGNTVKCPSCGASFEVKSSRGDGKSLDKTLIAASTTDPSSTPPGEKSRPDTSSGNSSLPGLAKAANREPTLHKLGRFEVKQLLGEGGFGRVYRAYDQQLDRFVALKIPTFPISDKSRVKRFLTEAKAAAQLRHPNIVPTFDSGQADDKLYIAAQFISGQPLNDRIKKGKITPRDAARWVAKIADAVHYAHEQGIVHRDIKPHNVMLDKKDEPQLMDFGLAKRVDEESSMTIDGSLLGTPAYMSPEQARGEHKNVGPASDQYSVGVILYELLTGRKPFSGAPHSVIAQVTSREPQTIRECDPKLPRDLDAICQKAMSKEPSSRYASSSELAEDLRAWLDGRPTRARTPGPLERVVFWVRRNPVTAGLSSVLAASLIVGTVVSISFAIHANQQKQLAVDAAKEAGVAKDKALAAGEAERQARLDVVSERDRAKEAEQKATSEAANARIAESTAKTAEAEALVAKEKTEATLARSNYHLAQARWDAKQADSARVLLQDIPPEYRNLEWNLALQTFRGSDVTCYGHTQMVVTIAYTPDGLSIVSGSQDGTIRTWNATTGAELQQFEAHAELAGQDGVREIAVSPDGRFVASISSHRDPAVEIRDLQTGSVEKLIRPISRQHHLGLSFSSVKKLLAIAGGDGSVLLRNMEDGTTESFLAYPGSFVNYLQLNADGKLLVTSGRNGTVNVWNVESQESVVTINQDSTEVIYQVVFSPDSQVVAGVDMQNIWIWDATTGKEVRGIHSLAGTLYTRLAFSPDGRWIAAGAMDNAVHIWNAQNGQEVMQLKGHSDFVMCIAFSPDGSHLASGSQDGTVKIWDVTCGDRAMSLRGHQKGMNYKTGISQIAISPDSKVLASAGQDGALKIWNAVSGEEISTLFAHITPVNSDSKAGNMNSPGFQSRPPPDRSLNSVSIADDMVVATGSADGTIRVWDARQSMNIWTKEAHNGSVSCVAMSPDGRTLASCGNDNLVIIWDGQNGERLGILSGHAGGSTIGCVSFDASGKYVASGGSDKTVRLWDATTRQQVRETAVSGAPKVLSFNRSGRTLTAGARNGTIQTWDTASGELVKTIWGDGYGVSSIAITIDDKRIVGNNANYLKIWDAVDGKEVWSTQAGSHRSLEPAIAMAPDESFIAVGSDDGRIRLLDARSNVETRHLQGLPELASEVAFSGDGTFVIGRDQSGSEAVWDLATLQPTESAVPQSALSPSQLSPDKRYLALPSRKYVVVCDMQFRDTPFECAYQKAKAALSHDWHLQQGIDSHVEGNHFAAAFHYSWSLKAEPDSALASIGLALISRQIAGSDAKLPHGIRATDLSKPVAVDREILRRQAGMLRPLVSQLRLRQDLEKSIVMVSVYLQSDASPPHVIYGIHALSQELSNSQRLELEKLFPFVRDVLNKPLPTLTKEAAVTQTNEAWATLVSSDGNSGNHLFTLGMLTQNCEQFPNEESFAALGAAFYRVGRFPEAISTLQKQQGTSIESHTTAKALAFLAMSQFQTGDIRNARETQAKLSTLMKEPDYQSDELLKSVFLEMNALLNK